MNKLVLIDSNSLLNKAFYALPPLTSRSGLPTNAVLGYLNMLTKIIKDIKPTHIIATFDVKAPTFRKEMYADYKAHRKPMPEELAAQLPLAKEMLGHMNISIVELAGYEADDLIGTLARKCEFDTVIVTGDKDSLQLVSDTTTVVLAKRGISDIIEYTPARLLEDRLLPSQIIDLKSLMGDASDNIPGVAGVGEKTAMTLIGDYGTLDNVYANVENLKGKLKERLIENKEVAYLSYKLATINVDSPVDFDADSCLLQYPFSAELLPYLEELNFKSAIARLEFAGEIKPRRVARETAIVNIKDMVAFDKLVSKIEQQKKVALAIESSCVRIAISEDAEYIITQPSGFLDSSIDYNCVIEKCRFLCSSSEITTIFSDSKAAMHYLNISNAKAYEDISLMAYLLDATRSYKTFADVATDYDFNAVNVASTLYAMNKELGRMIIEKQLDNLYREVELPLARVLCNMENAGLRVDRELMSSLSEQYSSYLQQLTADIYELAGESFNISSTQQLATILFEKLNLKHGKKNKTGSYSTNVDVLESLRGEHEIIGKILDYRGMAKLQSTYILGLEGLLDGKDKLHTNFKQNLTATGRLSSTEPNLQNIPIRKPEGRKLRKMFIASQGNKLVAADYSQIELRLLAHFSGDKVLCEAYKSNADIHSYTASLIFHIPLELVSKEMRSRAKAVNFGIIYGISDFGLSNDVGCSIAEARQFIVSYFDTYPAVKSYLDNQVAYARTNGYVKTLLGRLRYIPDIRSSNANIRNFAERVAMNMPLQGSASDIIKVAMVKVHDEIEMQGLSARMVLQVHDELLIDCPEGEVAQVSEILGRCMCSAVELNIPLVADVMVGDNWYDTK